MKDFRNINYSVLQADEKPFAEVIRVIEGNITKQIPTQYIIKMKFGLQQENHIQEYIIQRRFNDFYKSINLIKTKHIHLIFPAIPDKSIIKNIEERRKVFEQFLNKILSMENWKDFVELKNLFSNQQSIQIEDESQVQKFKSGMKKISVFLSGLIKQSSPQFPEFFNKQKIIDMDQQLEKLRMDIEYEELRINKIIQAFNEVKNSSNKSIEAFSELEHDFEELQTAQFSNDLETHNFKETLNMFSKKFKMNSYSCEKMKISTEKEIFLFKVLQMDILETINTIKKFLDYKNQFVEQWKIQIEGQISNQALQEQELEYEQTLQHLIQNLEKVKTSQLQDKNQLIEMRLIGFNSILKEMESEWKQRNNQCYESYLSNQTFYLFLQKSIKNLVRKQQKC